jgi:hypothetical protein
VSTTSPKKGILSMGKGNRRGRSTKRRSETRRAGRRSKAGRPSPMNERRMHHRQGRTLPIRSWQRFFFDHVGRTHEGAAV